MLIILEGPDGVGKSTLAERLVTHLAAHQPRDTVTLIHRGPPTQHPLNEYAVPLLDYQPGRGQHLIIDRWHWGETVYPHVLDRKTQMTPEMFAYIEMLITQRGGLVVSMTAPPTLLMRRIERRGDDLIGPGHVRTLVHLFRRVERESVLPRLQIDVSVAHLSLQPSVIFEAARLREQEWVPFRRFVTPIASTSRPQVLLCGDVRACLGTNCRHWMRHSTLGTAFMPYAATSGHYLLGAALSTQPPVRWFAMVNACDADDVAHVWEAYGRPPMVALGQRAHRSLRANQLEHGVVPHPQFIRRFHHAAQAEYGRLIRQVAFDGRNELKWRPSTPKLGSSEPGRDERRTLTPSSMS